MQTIIGTEEKYRRKNNKRSGKDENGLTEKQRQRMERIEKAMELADKCKAIFKRFVLLA